MPTPKSKFNLKQNIENKFIAYIDVMGFSNLVNKGNIDDLDSYFSKITDELTAIRKDKGKIESFLISDSIILISPPGLNGLKQLLTAIRRIQSALLWRKILLRGAVSFGEVYYNNQNNIIVGKGFIRAYLLEKEAIFPRVIIDPTIIRKVAPDKRGFLQLLNSLPEYTFENRVIYTKSEYSQIPDDGIFIDYANKTIKQKELNGNISKIYQTIIDNLYTEQKLYSKYVWFRDYFIESFKLTTSLLTSNSEIEKAYKKELKDWLAKFERL